ncbi:MAG: chemotaxis protein CheA, partial [Phycisphaerae bacterium]|nr:chemotaxis protein CheA [Phycisphaerae bacterium]
MTTSDASGDDRIEPFGGGFSMFELFRSEAETHSRTMSEGLLALETRPDDLAALEPLMRAAHSIKGAARIIGVDAAVRLAHAMEDVFVAGQKGRERLATPRIDQLLAATDVLAKLAGVTEAQLPLWTTDHEEAIDALVKALSAAPPAPKEPAKPTTAVPQPGIEPQPATPAPSPAAPGTGVDSKSVRLSAEAIDRMMRLAGEMTIESRRVEWARDPMQSIKAQLLDLAEVLERLEEEIGARPRLAVARDRTHRIVSSVVQQLETSEELARRLEEVSTALYHATLGSRMRPFGEVAAGFPRLVRDLAKELEKTARFELIGASVPVDRDILAKLEAPINHMLRNAVDHAVEAPAVRVAAGKDPTARIRLEAMHHAGQLVVKVWDDGAGIDPERIRQKVIARGLSTSEVAGRLTSAELLEFLFLPGFSTASVVTEISGRGVGLDVVQSTARDVGGTASIESTLGRGTTFRLEVPVSLSVMRAAVVDIGGEPYAFPLARLERVVRMPHDALSTIEGRQQFLLDGKSVGLVDAARVLDVKPGERSEDVASVMVVAHGRGADEEWYGLLVDRFAGESDLVVRALDARLGKVPHIAAASLLATGEPLLIVDVDDLVQSVRQFLSDGRLR